jgi:hypothetical protein
MRARPFVPAVLAALSCAAACGSSGAGGQGGAGGSDAGAPALAVFAGAPAPPAQAPASDDHAVDGYASAMAAGVGLAAAGTTTGVYRLDAAGPVLLPLVGDEPDLPADTGAVRAMAPYAAGILVVAENGVFWSSGDALQRSLAEATLKPLGITAMTARVTAGDDGGPGETQLALIAGGAAYELGGGQLTTWSVPGEGGAPTAIFAQEARVYLAYAGRAYEIDRATKTAYPLPEGVGAVRAIACASLGCEAGSLLYFATEGGLVERGADGSYRRYPLAAAGEPAVPVTAFALDGDKQRLYALAGASLLRVRAGQIPDAVASLDPPKAPRHLAVDGAGDVWVGEGLSTKRLALGTPLSFATDARPILHEYCAGCHAQGTQGAPQQDFESYAVAVSQIGAILARVEGGTMPPVSYGKKLPAEQIHVLESWATTKAP